MVLIYLVTPKKLQQTAALYECVGWHFSIFWNLTNSEETVYVCSNHIREHYAPNWLNNVTKILGFFLFRNFTLPGKLKYHISN